MKLAINIDGNIGDVQNQFNAYFPFLKLEFYGLHDAITQKSRGKPFLDPRYKLRDAKKKLTQGEIPMKDNMTVAELEKKLYDTFGIYAEVLRKSGNIWLETTLTSDWTLLQQNIMGETIS